MNTPSKKTMIWRGGLVAVSGGRDQTRIGTGDALAAVLAEARAKEAARSEVQSQSAALEANSDAKASGNASPSLDAVATAAPSPAVRTVDVAASELSMSAKPTVPVCASTRIMPIEALFPDASGAPQTQDAAPQREAPDAAQPLPRAAWQRHALELLQQGRALIARDAKRSALYGGAAVVMLGLALWPAPQDETPEAKGVATQSQQQAAAAERVAPAAEDNAKQAFVPVAPLPANGLERSAVDALASGDLERAQQLYLQLAERAPRPSPFSEAARILARSADEER